jgi:DNA-binding transcriptional MerR regulator
LKKLNGEVYLTTKELAEVAAEPYDTIDHWSGEDLLEYRLLGRNRFYVKDVNLKRCKRIRELQNDGHTLRAIKKQFRKEG